MISRARMLRLLATASRVAVWVLLRVLPARPHAVVHGWPDDEANAVEVVRALRRRYRGRVYWLLNDPAYRGPLFAAEELADSRRVVRLRKGSARAVVVSLTAELTFFTHGLYTAVTPPSNRLVVNLWHGDGPKSSRDTHLVRSTVVVSGSELWSRYKAEIFGVPLGSVAVVGNPRVDQFAEELSADSSEALSLAEGRTRVLWLPTYREAKGPRQRAWSDGEHLTQSDDVNDLARATAETALRLGIDVIIKPHPLDLDSYAGMGVRVIRGAELNEAGVSLYQLIGHCDALVSDISSVWVDYLALDRPIGFYIPDLAELTERRGLNVDDFESLMPGRRITSSEDARDFLTDVARGAKELRPSAYPGFKRIAVPDGHRVADRLLDWLADFQRNRGRREELFSAGGT